MIKKLKQRMPKLNYRKLGLVLGWTVLISGLLIVLGFVESEQKTLPCKEVDVTIVTAEDNFFIDRRNVINIVTDYGGEIALIGHPLSRIEAGEMERLLEHNPYIADAEVYLNIAGELKLNVVQRRPIMRVINSEGVSYYLDDRGLKMPLSDQYTSRLVVATGAIAENYHGRDSLVTSTAHQLYALATFIDQHEFWKAQIEQVYVDEQGELILVPRVGNQDILLGDTTDMEKKFAKLFVFYKEGLNKTGWNNYSMINLKYDKQVVCTKK